MARSSATLFPCPPTSPAAAGRSARRRRARAARCSPGGASRSRSSRRRRFASRSPRRPTRRRRRSPLPSTRNISSAVPPARCSAKARSCSRMCRSPRRDGRSSSSAMTTSGSIRVSAALPSKRSTTRDAPHLPRRSWMTRACPRRPFAPRGRAWCSRTVAVPPPLAQA